LARKTFADYYRLVVRKKGVAMFQKIFVLVVFGFVNINMIFATGETEIIGNGNIVIVDRTVSLPFNSIELTTGLIINLYQADEPRIEIKADSDIEPYIQTEIDNNVLTIQRTHGVRLRPTECIILVYMPNIASLKSSGSGRIIFMDTIKTDNLKLEITGSGEIEGRIESENLNMRISGSGKIRLSGTSNKAVIGITGSGRIDSENLEIENAEISVSGSGEVRVTVNNRLEGRISGSGDILYKGNPTITFNSSGSGELRAIR
jgi:hypothetical protein